MRGPFVPAYLLRAAHAEAYRWYRLFVAAIEHGQGEVVLAGVYQSSEINVHVQSMAFALNGQGLRLVFDVFVCTGDKVSLIRWVAPCVPCCVSPVVCPVVCALLCALLFALLCVPCCVCPVVCPGVRPVV